MKKALYVGNFASPDINAAGKRVLGVSLLLRECGYSIEMIGYQPGFTEKVDIANGITFSSFPDYGKSAGKKYIEWLKGKDSSTIDLIVRYGSPGLATFDYYLWKYAKNHKIPLIADVVDWLYAASSNPVFNIIKSCDTFLEKAFLNQYCCDGIIAISSFLYNFYKFPPQKKIIIPPLAERYKDNTTTNRVPRIIYAGIPFRLGTTIKKNIQMKDRIDIIFKVFYRLEMRGIPFETNIIGITKSDFITAFPAYANDANQTKQIIFAGKKTMQQIEEIYSEMDFSILIRDITRATTAGFPTKIVESMSLGVPAITNRTSDIAHYITNRTNGFLVDASNNQTLEDQIMRVLETSEPELKEIKKRVFEEKRFSSQSFKHDFVTFLKSFQ